MKFKSHRRGYKNPHTSKRKNTKHKQKIQAPRFTHVVAMCQPFETPLKDHIGTEEECRIQAMLMNLTRGARSYNVHYAVMTNSEFSVYAKQHKEEQVIWAEAKKELAYA